MSYEVARFRDITEYSTNAMIIFILKILTAAPLSYIPIVIAKVVQVEGKTKFI